MNESNDFTGGDAHGMTEADAGARGPGDRAEARRPVQPRHHLRAGHSRVDVLPLDRRPQEQAAARVKRGTKKEEATFKQTLLTTIRAAELARNQYWTAAAWLLERTYPDEYGKADRRLDEEGAEAMPKIVLGVTMQPVQEQLGFGQAGGTDG